MVFKMSCFVRIFILWCLNLITVELFVVIVEASGSACVGDGGGGTDAPKRWRIPLGSHGALTYLWCHLSCQNNAGILQLVWGKILALFQYCTDRPLCLCVISEVLVKMPYVDGELPVYWWDSEADRCMVIGIFRHGTWLPVCNQL